jgi:heptosyltransferase-2
MEVRVPPSEFVHQQYDYAAALDVLELLNPPPAPWLRLTAEDRTAASWVTNLPDGPRLALMPGAARGPSKRWPAERFAAVAQTLARDGWHILVLGSPADREAGQRIAAAAGVRGHNYVGETTLGTWAAILAVCDLALCNDSGGMHLAAAMGLPGVAIFGATDPARTGPLGAGWTVLQKAPTRSARIGRTDPRARQWLETITVDEVVVACHQVWHRVGMRRIDR